MAKRGHPYKGLWITFEAGEGAGKGTQIKLLAEHLSDQEYRVTTGREPGHTLAGEEIRKILQHPEMPKLNSKTEMLLYVAAGIEFFEQSVKPILERGEIFLADRWRDSTKAYQGHGLGINLSVIDILTRFSCDEAYPDLTFLLDIDAELGLRKLTGNEFHGHEKDKIEQRSLEYHERVNKGYRKIAAQNSQRFRVISYQEGEIDRTQQQIREEVDKYIKQHKLQLTK